MKLQLKLDTIPPELIAQLAVYSYAAKVQASRREYRKRRAQSGWYSQPKMVEVKNEDVHTLSCPQRPPNPSLQADANCAHDWDMETDRCAHCGIHISKVWPEAIH